MERKSRKGVVGTLVALSRAVGFVRFAMFNQNGILWSFAKGEIDLTITDLRVLFSLWHFAERRNVVAKSHTYMAEKVGIDRSNFSRSVRKMVEMGLLTHLERNGESKVLTVSPCDMWKGDRKEHDTHIERFHRKRARDQMRKAA